MQHVPSLAHVVRKVAGTAATHILRNAGHLTYCLPDGTPCRQTKMFALARPIYRLDVEAKRVKPTTFLVTYHARRNGAVLHTVEADAPGPEFDLLVGV